MPWHSQVEKGTGYQNKAAYQSWSTIKTCFVIPILTQISLWVVIFKYGETLASLWLEAELGGEGGTKKRGILVQKKVTEQDLTRCCAPI